ncbi:hypothetical protein D3C71_1586010 [compost metagenome]
MPVSNGSSEKYSKFLPFRGLLWILIPGPSSVSILLISISLPRRSNNLSFSSVFHVQASIVPFGILVAFSALVSIRIPEGPSAALSIGSPNFSRFLVTPPKAAAVPAVTLGLDIPSPKIMAPRSLLDNCAMN